MILGRLYKIPKNTLATLLLAGLYIGAAAYLLSGYFVYNTNIYMGLLLAPYILNLHKGSLSYRFMLPSVFFLIAAFFMPVKSVLFLASLFGIMFLVENNIGKINNAFLFLLIAISPIFHYLSNTVGLPLRLWLSEITGYILSFMGQEVEVNGNFLILDGQEFSVDPACAGLKMMTTSVIIALSIISYHEKKTGLRAPVWKSSLFMLSTFVLNVICNLLRITLFIKFRIMPEYVMHDLAGIICLIVYVIVPLFIIARFMFGTKQPGQIPATPARSLSVKKMAFHGLLAIALLFTGKQTTMLNAEGPLPADYAIKGFQKQALKTGVVKFENQEALIYVKPMCYYAAEHSPMVCWTGSGYQFHQVGKTTINGKEIYTGIMRNGKEKIHTAWWFDNGKDQTINQLNWRWKSITGEGGFNLINVNALTKDKLMTETKKMLQNNHHQNLTHLERSN